MEGPMRRVRLFFVAAALLVVATTGAALTVRALGDGPAPSTVWVTGMRIDGKNATAHVRITNVSGDATNFFSVHYTVQAPGGGEPLSLLAAGPNGATLLNGRTLELDLGEIVTKYRASFGSPAYRGPVRLVAYATSTGVPFGPDTVQVSVVQKEGAAMFDPLVEWR